MPDASTLHPPMVIGIHARPRAKRLRCCSWLQGTAAKRCTLLWDLEGLLILLYCFFPCNMCMCVCFFFVLGAGFGVEGKNMLASKWNSRLGCATFCLPVAQAAPILLTQNQALSAFFCLALRFFDPLSICCLFFFLCFLGCLASGSFAYVTFWFPCYIVFWLTLPVRYLPLWLFSTSDTVVFPFAARS